jgi:hypothetical protein
VGQERGPLSLLSKTEELLKRKSSGSGLENRRADQVAPSIRKSWHQLRRQAEVRSQTQATEFFIKYISISIAVFITTSSSTLLGWFPCYFARVCLSLRLELSL